MKIKIKVMIWLFLSVLTIAYYGQPKEAEPVMAPLPKPIELPAPKKQDKSEDDSKYVMNLPTTAYSLDVRCTGKSPSHPDYGLTATGISVFDNPYVVAADPKRIPLYSILYISGLGQIS